MPKALLKACAGPNCPTLVVRGRCPACRLQQSRDRGHRLYDDRRWRDRRARFLRRHPFCEECAKVQRVTAANTVDHRIPHRGNLALFWDETNWSALCKSHHDQKTNRERAER